MFGDKSFLTVAVVAGLFLTFATTEFVRTLPQAQAGLVTYERTCPISSAPAGAHHAR